MANTWTVFVQGAAFAVNKPMIGLVNAGARVLRVRRIGMLNNQTGVVTGVVCFGEIRRYTGAGISGHTPQSPMSHDSTNSALSSVTAYTNGVPTGTGPDVLRRYLWSSDEPAVSGATIDELQCLPALTLLWDAGYGDANVQPLTLRQNEQIVVYNTVGAAGIADLWIEFTDEAS